MLTKKLTYTDYDGVERTETFYFNLSKAEIMKLQLSYPGGFAEHIERIIDAKNTVELMNLFNELIDLAYGEKSEDGKRIVKSKEITEAFKQTEAYSELFVMLLSDADAAVEFVNGILPNMGDQDEREKLIAKTKARIEGKEVED